MTKRKQPSNIVEIMEFCIKNGTDVANGDMNGDRCKESTNAMGKALKAIAIQLEYAKLRKERPEVSFIKAPKVG